MRHLIETFYPSSNRPQQYTQMLLYDRPVIEMLHQKDNSVEKGGIEKLNQSMNHLSALLFYLL